MNKIKFVYFDIGGVMADTDDYFKNVTDKFGISIQEFYQFWLGSDKADAMTKGRMTAQEFWNKAIKQFELNNAGDFNFLESWVDDYKPNLEVHELAQKVSAKYEIGLLSNLYPGMMPRLIEKGKVPSLAYSAIVLSNEVGYRKPEPEIYKIATKKAGVNPEEIFFIDDKEDFIEGAKNFGWQTILFNSENINRSIKEAEEMLD